MTLTEQWKKGELEAGWYYVLLFSNEEYITFVDGNWVVDDRLIEADIKEVLAPVPSYEEYSRLEWYAGCGPDRIVELNHENRKLKELLKECRERLGDYAEFCIKGGYLNAEDEAVKMITKVDNAIGEKNNGN